MGRVSVEQLIVGKPVDSTFLVNRANLRPFTRGQMLSLKLSDATGRVDAVMWDGTEPAAKIAQIGKIIRIKGLVGQYQGETQITIQSLTGAEPLPPEGMAAFVPVSDRSADEMREELEAYRNSLESDLFRALWNAFLNDANTWKLFTLAPGGKRWHHAYLGGLLEHTCSVLKLADFFARTYPGIDRDLLMTGALFHDVGKTRELSFDTAFDYTNEGRLIGHLVIGHDMVCQYAREIEGFPADRLLLLKHLILSHHDDLGGSPIVSMTREAFLLHHADRLDSMIMAVSREMEEARVQGTGEWTGFINLIDRQLYLGPKPQTEERFSESLFSQQGKTP